MNDEEEARKKYTQTVFVHYIKCGAYWCGFFSFFRVLSHPQQVVDQNEPRIRLKFGSMHEVSEASQLHAER